MVSNEEQDRLKKIYEQQKVPATVLKSKESSGMSAFLKKGDPKNLSDLKQKYFTQSQTAFKRPEDKIQNWQDVERYIDRTKRSRRL